VKQLTLLVYFFISIAGAGELTGFGFASVVEQGENRILEVGDENNVFRVKLDEKTYKKEIAALEISSDAKTKALEVGRKFFQSFHSSQTDVENYLIKSWNMQLDDYSADGQEQLLSPDGCDKTEVPVPQNVFKSIAFEIPSKAMHEFHRSMSSFSGGRQLVVVDIEDVRKHDQGGILGKVSLQKVIDGYDVNESKTALTFVQLEIAESMNTLPENLYIMTQDAADSFKIPYHDTFSDIRVTNKDLLSPTIEFNSSNLKVLEGLEANDFGGVQSYLDRNTNIVDRYENQETRGQVSEAPKLPNLRDINFIAMAEWKFAD
jgi:hypothetical protein